MQANVQTDTADHRDDSPSREAGALAADQTTADHVIGQSLVYSRLPNYAEYLAQRPDLRRSFAIRMGEIRIAPEDQHFFVSYPHWLRLLAVVEERSPATLTVLPLWAHILAFSPRLDLRMLAAAQAPASLAALCGDAQARTVLADAELPLLLALDDTWQVQAHWGPHPRAAQAHLARWHAAHPTFPAGNAADPALAMQFAQELRLWYNSGLNRACAAELREFLAGLLPV